MRNVTHFLSVKKRVLYFLIFIGNLAHSLKCCYSELDDSWKTKRKKPKVGAVKNCLKLLTALTAVFWSALLRDVFATCPSEVSIKSKRNLMQTLVFFFSFGISAFKAKSTVSLKDSYSFSSFVFCALQACSKQRNTEEEIKTRIKKITGVPSETLAHWFTGCKPTAKPSPSFVLAMCFLDGWESPFREK